MSLPAFLISPLLPLPLHELAERKRHLSRDPSGRSLDYNFDPGWRNTSPLTFDTAVPFPDPRVASTMLMNHGYSTRALQRDIGRLFALLSHSVPTEVLGARANYPREHLAPPPLN